ncbi:MAG: anti-sigma factor antagonist [Solobacterium sp.]|nr:anti-sigma factor antagonist [Solobacterium sp.]
MSENKKETIEITLNGRIDSNNAAAAETDIMAQLGGNADVPVVVNAENLEYISSAGLRVLLRVRKVNPHVTITNVSSEIFEILEMTGFTELMTVEKAYRVVDVTGCEEIGRGANGSIYRIDQDNVVKVYNNADALEDIQHEREVARLALILGIPTAISYDVVKVGNSYGSVFELLNASSFSKILATEPEKMDWCVQEYVEMLKKIHDTEVPEGKLPDMKKKVVKWAQFMQDYLPEEAGKKLLSLVEAVPQNNHMIHGDYHTKNLELQNDEVLLIDMDTLAVGDPIFELASMYMSFIGFSELDHTVVKKFQGFDFEFSKQFWHKALAAYLGTDSETKIREVENKARIVAYTRLIRRSIRRGGRDDPAANAEIEHWKKELLELLAETDTLTFLRNELEIEADEKNLPEVLSFIETHLEEAGCGMKEKMQINVAAEEIFVNIAQYAYAPDKGRAVVRVEVTKDPVTVTLTFIDHGTPYDPLAKDDPDVTLSAEERQIGGLGIFIAKQTMDEVKYEYKEGKNILKLEKHI